MKKYSTMEMAMKLVGGKWKCLILYQLVNGPKRTRDLLQLLENISQKVLIEQLRQLEADSLIEREVFAEVPPKVEYRLSSEGETFVPILYALCNWSIEYDARHDKLIKPCAGQSTIPSAASRYGC